MKNLSPKTLGEIRMTDKERNMRKELKRAARPRIASTIVLTHGPKDNPHILMGQRSSKHDFMPSVYVFPGGRVDRGDSYVDYAGDLFAGIAMSIMQEIYPLERKPSWKQPSRPAKLVPWCSPLCARLMRKPPCY